MRDIADEFVACLGPRHTIPSHIVLSRDSAGCVQVLVIQPFVAHARRLEQVRWETLSPEERESVGSQLHEIVECELRLYRETGRMPDLYGMSSSNQAERRRLAA